MLEVNTVNMYVNSPETRTLIILRGIAILPSAYFSLDVLSAVWVKI